MLDSTSTLQEILDAYADNASYAEDGSAAKARGFVTACRLLLLQLPKRAASGGRGGEEIELDPLVIENQLNQARQWLARNDVSASAGRVRHCDLSGFRD